MAEPEFKGRDLCPLKYSAIRFVGGQGETFLSYGWYLATIHEELGSYWTFIPEKLH